MKLAIQFFGHTRTYESTYKNFLKYVCDANKQDGWEIDIFIHTWNMKSSSVGSWHEEQNLFYESPLTLEDEEKIKLFYKPVRFLIDEAPKGIHAAELSKQRGNVIREEYEKERDIKYDYILYTRMDVLFTRSLKLNYYLKEYENHVWLKLPSRHVFCAHNLFKRMRVADPRYINEGDIICFSNFSQYELKPERSKECLVVLIDFIMHRDFFLQRERFIFDWDRREKILKEEQLIFNFRNWAR
ncbi:TPA: hypothetical protein SD903_001750, partial [Campylobacter jejuni]|nr:hypothetical protein [Campylobacter jejuni]